MVEDIPPIHCVFRCSRYNDVLLVEMKSFVFGSPLPHWGCLGCCGTTLVGIMFDVFCSKPAPYENAAKSVEFTFSDISFCSLLYVQIRNIERNNLVFSVSLPTTPVMGGLAF